MSRLLRRLGEKALHHVRLRPTSALLSSQQPHPLRLPATHAPPHTQRSLSSDSTQSTATQQQQPYVSGDSTHFGFDQVNVAEKEGKVRQVFDSVADSYDVMNDFMSAGVHRLWKDYLLDVSGVATLAKTARAHNLDLRILDVAGGTGDVAFRFVEAADCVERAKSSGLDPVSITVCDINHEMLRVGEQRARQRFGGALLEESQALRFTPGNAQDLEGVADNSFDLYTIAFGLRNVTDVDAALREANRVLKPGGRFICLEFSKVPNESLRQLYDLYSFQMIPWLGEMVANDRASYQYLVESIRRFSDQDELLQRMKAAGLTQCRYTNLTGGVVALHEGWKAIDCEANDDEDTVAKASQEETHKPTTSSFSSGTSTTRKLDRWSGHTTRSMSTSTNTSDPPIWTWVDRYLPTDWQPYARLARLDKPIGTWLLLWPCCWSTALAQPVSSMEHVSLLALFGVGALTMRGAGCTINDLWDRDIDQAVPRTQQRPLVSGDLTPSQAVQFLGLQLATGCAVLVSLPHTWYCFQWGVASLPLVVLYPTTKRYFPYPQLVLGLCMNWGALMGWAAVHGTMDWTVVAPLYLSGVTWTLVYDTLYAHQDKGDDAKLGLYSTALTFGKDAEGQRAILHALAATTYGLWATAGYQAGMDYPALYAVGITAAYSHLLWQVHTADLEDPHNLASRFRSNAVTGALVYAALLAGHPPTILF
jgi:4-hydroxybenzoate polyprenyl transferase